jgi:DNA-binding CsgD family transcriptional regulator
MSLPSSTTAATTRRRALAHFRQLCSLGVPPAQVVPDLMRTLHALIPARQNMLIWTAPDGQPTGRYCEDFQPQARAAYESGRLEGRPDLAALARDGRRTGNLRAMPAAFYRSPYFALVRRPHDAWHSLDGVARRGTQPLAVLIMHRERGHSFDDQDEVLLASLLPHVEHALSVPSSAPVAPDEAMPADDAVLMCDADGTLQCWTPSALQWLDRLQATIGDSPRRLPPPLLALCERLRALSAGAAAAPPACRLDGPWGSLLARATPLEGRGTQGGAGVMIRLHAPVAPALQLARALADHPLSPRRREVALQLAFGVPPAQIARKLGIRPSTCKEYIADVYAALGVSRQAELVARLQATAAQ